MAASLMERVRVVLIHTQNPQNLGAVARVMKNCGASRLTLVSPLTDDLTTARRVAVRAEELLESPPTVTSLEEGTRDAVWVIGTTSREIPGRPSLTPREVAAQAAARLSQGEVALVLGAERTGMTNEELLSCHALSSIPSVGQPSFNLAQAALVFLYELMLAVEQPDPPVAREGSSATDSQIAALAPVLREVLDASKFADPDRPGHGVAELLNTLRRASLSQSEASLWTAALRGMQRHLVRRER